MSNNLYRVPATGVTRDSQLSASLPSTVNCCGPMCMAPYAGRNTNAVANGTTSLMANAGTFDDIATDFDEAEHLVKLTRAIERIEPEISGNSEFEGYRLAREQNPAYVSNEAFTIGFLRAEFYEAEKAAIRMFEYLNMKLDIFGTEKLTQDILLDDLGEGGKEYLERGGLQLLPKPDSTGRRVVFGHGVLNGRATESDAESAKKAFFYFWTCVSDDADERGKKLGMVGILWRVHNPPMPDAVLSNYLSRIWRCAPIRLIDYHMCYGSITNFEKRFKTILLAWMTTTKFNPRQHSGGTIEVMYQLQEHGIPIDCLPLELGADPRIHNRDHVNGWMARRRSIDQDRREIQALRTSTMSSTSFRTSDVSASYLFNSLRTSDVSVERILNSLRTRTSDQSMQIDFPFDIWPSIESMDFEILEDTHYDMLNESYPPVPDRGNDNPGAINDTNMNDVNDSQPYGDRDILLGQGRHNHAGNIWFRNLIFERYDEYNSLDRLGKTEFSTEIVQMIRVERRRFYIREGNNWVEMNDDKRARLKVTSHFRDERERRAEAGATSDDSLESGLTTPSSLSGD
mmetsp:Transcript_8688/g.21375  ORF Transcript_8688/g.21375 Transcript_8688/m.21375 type:complete len:570 (-) Transcript_8688:303-2012(-)